MLLCINQLSTQSRVLFLLSLFMLLQESEEVVDSQNVDGVSTDTFQPSIQV